MSEGTTFEQNCTLLVAFDGNKQQLSPKELKDQIEKGNTEDRIRAVKEMISLTLNGEPQTKLIMSVIKFIQPQGTTTSSNEKNDKSMHQLKKLVLYFWEIVDKKDEQGKLRPELILLVDFLRRDLSHPNEYVIGATLRFLCNLKETEILEPLAQAVLTNLDHRQSYIRRNAVLAITNIYQRTPEALPHAPEAVEAFLQGETDVTAKRNAFLMLFKCTPDRAVSYLRNLMETSDIGQSQDVFQLVVVELLKQLMQTNPHDKSQYIKIIFTLLQSKSQAVLFQCASTLLALSSSPTAIQASADTLVNLLNNNCDNNVKLVVVGKLEEIKKRFPEALQGLTMDLLRCLVGSEMEIQRRILDLTIDLVSAKNVEKVLAFLKKELIATSAANAAAATKGETDYRQLLVKFIHQTTVKHKQVAPTIIPILMDFIVEDSKSASDTILFIREMVHRQPELREFVLTKLAMQFTAITSTRVFRIALWILGTHASTYEEVRNVMNALKEALWPFPLWIVPEAEDEEDAVLTGGGAVVRSDGTYGQAEVEEKKEERESTSFRSLITDNDWFLTTVLASAMVKLVSTCYGLEGCSHHKQEQLRKEAAEVVENIIQLGIHKGMDTDSHERMRVCLKLLENPKSKMMEKYTSLMLKGFSEMLVEEDETKQKENEEKDEEKKFVPVDTPIHFSQLVRTKKGDKDAFINLEDVEVAAKNDSLHTQSQRLKNVVCLAVPQPVYVEGTVEVHQFDILLEMLVVNKTQDTLQNLTVELGTVGDLRLCERPQTYTLAPAEEVIIKANMKVSSTEAGVIFGNIVFDSSKAGQDQTVVVLNDLHIDIIDYVHPASCNATAFRTMWQDFEWENRLIVATEIKSLREYLDHILKHTNMRCQAMSTSLAGEADFLSANLLAKSSFGEPVVANISVSRQPNGNIEGYVRIRSRSQGIALGLGEKITMKQKGGK